MNPMDYWAGVVCGMCCSMLLCAIVQFVTASDIKRLQASIADLEKRLERVEGIEEENKTVMQTYKFFNQSWQAIIDMEKKEEK